MMKNRVAGAAYKNVVRKKTAIIHKRKVAAALRKMDYRKQAMVWKTDETRE